MDETLAKRIGRLTHELCSIPSVTGDEQALCDRIEAWARPLFPGALHRVGNTLLAGRLDDPRPAIALFGHLDTVPGAPDEPHPTLEADRVVGLGSSDMKGGVAVMMALAEDLAHDRLLVNPVFVFYDREEGPYEENGLGPLFEQHPALARAAFAIALESTDLEVQVGCVGSLHARLTFQGTRAHSARPWQGDNAIHRAAPLLTKLSERDYDEVDCEGCRFFESMSATLAHGGIARNVVPDHFELNLNYRFAPSRTLEEAEKELRAFAERHAEVEIIDRSPAGRVCSKNRHFRRLLLASGGVATPKQAWTDVGRLSALGIDAVNYGPGLTSQAHQRGEYIPLENLERCYERLTAFLISA